MTTADIEALNLGYLTGADLLQFCSPQLLISRWNVNNSNLQRGCSFAYSEIMRNLSNRYDATDEFKNSRLVTNIATAVLASGAITAINITNPGLYTAPPAIIITDSTGNGAEAAATITGTVLSAITVLTGGRLYTAPVISADQRENVLVQIAAVFAVRKILGNFEKLSQEMKDNFTWAENSLMDIRNGEMTLILPEAAKIQVSTSQLVCARFRTLG